MTNDEIFDLARHENKETEKFKKQLTKYKWAFEILRELIKVEKSEGIEKEIIGYEFGVMARPIDKKITKEEYELLEELMRDETENRN